MEGAAGDRTSRNGDKLAADCPERGCGPSCSIKGPLHFYFLMLHAPLLSCDDACAAWHGLWRNLRRKVLAIRTVRWAFCITTRARELSTIAGPSLPSYL